MRFPHLLLGAIFFALLAIPINLGAATFDCSVLDDHKTFVFDYAYDYGDVVSELPATASWKPCDDNTVVGTHAGRTTQHTYKDRLAMLKSRHYKIYKPPS